MPALTVSLLGPCIASLDGEALLPFRTNKVQALLVYLLTETAFDPGFVARRDTLMSLLWPGMPESSARQNLRQALYLLRQALPQVDGSDGATVSLLVGDRNALQLNARARYELDITRFLALLRAGGQTELAAAVEIYRDDFLVDFYLPDSNEFELWASARRADLRRRMMECLNRLAKEALQRSQYAATINYARRQLELDGLHEPAFRQLMEALVRSGQRVAALAEYEKCRQLLRTEMGVLPSLETQQLYTAIRDGKMVASEPANRIKGYELVEMVSDGNYANLYRAYQSNIGREVAIKVITSEHADDPEFIRRFETEAQFVAQLEHPHVVPLYDYWREPGGAFLVMRWVRGGTLLSALSGKRWPVAQVVRLGEQLASALAAAHELGIVHRDVKPANVLLDERQNAYLSDFSIAQSVGSQRRSEGISGTPAYMAPEQLLEQPVTPAADQYALGILLHELLGGEHPFAGSGPALLIKQQLSEPLPPLPDVPEALNAVLQRATAKDPAARFEDMHRFALALRAAEESQGERAPAAPFRSVPTPYVGLRPFSEADAPRFYGREALVEQLLTALATTSFLALVGPSGSGKSSVVRAGLVPALRAGRLAGSASWFVARMVPGRLPFQALEAALLGVAVEPRPGLLPELLAREDGLVAAVEQILPPEAEGLLLVIDEFEELFTLVEDEESRRHFLNNLAVAGRERDGKLRVVITLRADYYDRPLAYQRFGELMRRHTVVVIPPNKEELARAIRGPAEGVGVGVEDELVTAIVTDVYDEPGALPLLQYALTELFERRETNRMVLADYTAVGGVNGALARRAEELFQKLDDKGQRAARPLFLRLVALGEGTPDTPRRVARVELDTIAGQMGRGEREPLGPYIEDVISLYGKYRLLSFDNDPVTRTPTVQLAHTALLHAWPRLHAWLQEGRTDLRQQARLRRWAAEWQQAERTNGLLLRGTRLDQMERWAASTSMPLTNLEQAFLQASSQAREHRRQAEAERQRRELNTIERLVETERARAVEQAAAAERFRKQALSLSMALAMAGRQRQLARSRELAAAALLCLNDDPELSVLLALEALAVMHTQEAENALHQAIIVSPVVHTLRGHGTFVEQAAFSPDGRLLATASWDRTLKVWDVERGVLLRTLGGHTGLVHDVAFAPDGRQIASASADGTARIWSVDSGELLNTFSGHEGAVTEVVFSPDGELIASASQDGRVRLWERESGQLRQALGKMKFEVWVLAFSPDGRYLACGCDGSGVMIRDVQSGQEVAALARGQSMVVGLAFHPTGRYLAVERLDGTVALWKLDLPESVELHLTLHGARTSGATASVNFTPDGEHVLALGADRQVTVWEVETGREAWRFLGHPSPASMSLSPSGSLVAVTSEDSSVKICRFGPTYEWLTVSDTHGALLSVAMDASGEVLYTGGADGRLCAWDLRSPGVQTDAPLFERRLSGSGLTDIKVNHAGRQLALAAMDGVVRVWNGQGSGAPLELRGHTGMLWRLAFSPDGSHLASASSDATVRIWEVTTGEQRLVLSGHNDWVTGVGFDARGARLLTSSADGTARVWDARSGRELYVLDHTYPVWDVAADPRGRYVATGSNEAFVQLWDLETDAADGPPEVQRLQGHAAVITALAFCPRGERIASASFDNSVRLWHIESGHQLLHLPGHRQAVRNVAFSRDGRLLASASLDRTARVHMLDLDVLIELARQRVTRKLTATERRRYLHTDVPLDGD